MSFAYRSRGAARLGRRNGWLVFAATVLVYASTAGGSLTTTDAVVTYQVTQRLVEERTFALPEGSAFDVPRGIDGRHYAPFGIAQSIYNIPFFLVGRIAQSVTGLQVGGQDTLPKAAVGFGNLVPAAAAVWVAYLFAWRLTSHIRHSVLAALALAFGSLLWPYSKFGFNAPLATLTLLGATYHLWVGTRTEYDRSLLWSGLLLGAAVLTRHEMILAVGPCFLWLTLESRSDHLLLIRRVKRFGVPVLTACLLWGSYNLARFGNPFDAGYIEANAMGFGQGLRSGMAGLFLSPGASVFLYAPVTIVGIVALIRQPDRRTALLFGLLAGTFVVFYATLGNWFGGRSYGPRYLVPLMPYLCIPLAPLLSQLRARVARVGVFAVILVSVTFQLPGVLVDYSRAGVAEVQSDRQSRSFTDRLDSWSAAPLMLNTRALLEAVPRNARYLLNLEPLPSFDRTESTGQVESLSSHLAFSLDFWWLYLFYLGLLPKWVALALGFTPLLGAAVILRNLAGNAKALQSRNALSQS